MNKVLFIPTKIKIVTFIYYYRITIIKIKKNNKIKIIIQLILTNKAY